VQLHHFLCGRNLQLVAGDSVQTDTECGIAPSTSCAFDTRRDRNIINLRRPELSCETVQGGAGQLEEAVAIILFDRKSAIEHQKIIRHAPHRGLFKIDLIERVALTQDCQPRSENREPMNYQSFHTIITGLPCNFSHPTCLSSKNSRSPTYVL